MTTRNQITNEQQNEQKRKINAFKLFITFCGAALVYAIAYFLNGYRMRKKDEGGFFQCDLGYGLGHEFFGFDRRPEKPFNFSTFHHRPLDDIQHNSDLLNPHMWRTLGMLWIIRTS